MSTIHRFNVSGMQLSSVVVSEQEWSDLMKVLFSMNRVVEVQSGRRMTDEQLKAIRDAKHLPMVRRGTLTEALFTHLGVEDDTMSVIVRGQGMSVYNQYIGQSQA